MFLNAYLQRRAAGPEKLGAGSHSREVPGILPSVRPQGSPQNARHVTGMRWPPEKPEQVELAGGGHRAHWLLFALLSQGLGQQILRLLTSHVGWTMLHGTFKLFQPFVLFDVLALETFLNSSPVILQMAISTVTQEN